MTLIEVLVALFILSTGILGAVAMQASAKKGSFDAMQRSMASSMAQDIVDRMRGNDAQSGALDLYSGSYGVTPLSAPANRCDATGSLCTRAEIATNDLYEWEQSLTGADVINGTANNGGLIGAVGCIEHNSNAVTIVISWEGREATSDGADADNGAFATGCGSTADNSKRRQIVVNAFIL